MGWEGCGGPARRITRNLAPLSANGTASEGVAKMTVRDTHDTHDTHDRHDKHGSKLDRAGRRTESTGAGASTTPSRALPAGKPRTALGQRLMNIRARIVASGETLLDWDAIEREIAERRGGPGEQEQELG